jgi:carbonic anhydrase
MDADEALLRLKAGNERFVRGALIHPHEGADWRRQLAAGVRPLATILGCSDSAAPPEIIFDQGLGDLFVIRVAGNVISADTLGSIQFAAVHLGTRLFVVLGHEDCGVVRAALEERAGKLPQPGQIETLMHLIRPALQAVDAAADFPTQLRAATEANVRWAMARIAEMPLARKAVKTRRVSIVGALHELQSGKVRFLG